MSKAITKEEMALLEEASETFNETGCVPGMGGEPVPAKSIVPDVKEYISETLTTRKQSMTRRYGIHRGLPSSFRGWRKNGIKNATCSRIAVARILSSI